MPPIGRKTKLGLSVGQIPGVTGVSRSEDDTVVGDDMSAVLEQRETLIRERQAELGGLYDRHDDLIREAFHMERFVTLLYYNPVEAKRDQTNVFREYKEKHDLAATAPVAGPSRTTRRAQNERISAISRNAQLPSTTAGPSATSLSKAASRPTITDHQSVSAAKKDTPKQKGPKWKRKVDNVSALTHESAESASAASGRVVRLSAKARGKQKATDESISSIPSTRSHSIAAADSATPPPLFPDSRRRGLRNHRVNDEPPPKKIREDTPPDAHIEESVSSARPTTARKTVAGKTVPSSTEPTSIPKLSIRRIRLIVKEPPPLISCYGQRVLPPKYNRSLSELLSSYTVIMGKERSPEELEEAAKYDARTLERVETLRKQGRFIRYLPDDDYVPAPVPQPKDPWAHIVNEVIAKHKLVEHRFFGFSGKEAGVVHTLLVSHWEAQKNREEREAAAEERRLRTLARTILRLVLAEWRRVEIHIREEERRAAELEEKRIGRQHLNDILDQSGHILEKQQMELIRADSLRSRSGSASMDTEDEDSEAASNDGTESASDNEADEEARSGDEESEVGISEAGTQFDEDEDAGTSALLSTDVIQDNQKETYVDFVVPLKDDDGDTTSQMENEDGLSRVDELDEEDHDDTASQHEIIVEDAPVSQNEDDQDIGLEKMHSPSTAATSATSTPITIAFDRDIVDDVVFDSPFEDTFTIQFDMARDLNEDSPVVSKAAPPEPQSEPLSKSFQPPLADISAIGVTEVNGRQVKSFSAVDGLPKLPSKRPNGHYKVVTKEIEVESPRQEASPILDDPAPADISGEELPHEKPNGHGHDLGVAGVSQDEETETGDRAQVDSSNPPPEHHPSPERETEPIVEPDSDTEIPEALQPYAVARVKWSPDAKIAPPLLLRGTLRPYQHAGLEWLASLHNNKMNGILADEMGLGKTIQTIALLAHLACDRGIWGPHLIIVPTSVLLNWEMEFKKFLPGFRILSYHGPSKRRKELRRGWFDKHNFNVCVTSYTLASKDHHVFKRKAWYYMILDEAHMIKNFRSQRWNILLMFRSFRRLLLTGTPLQNNLTELWALLQFLMSGAAFANLKDFGEWFSNPLEKAIEQGNLQDEEVQAQVAKLHTVLRPYLLRRLKRDVEKELPSKYEHLVLCRLSKRQRFLYDEFMSRSQTRQDLESGIYQKIANILMQLRKVCNHPDLFEVRPIVTSFAMDKSAIADFEIKELLVRRRLLQDEDRFTHVNLDFLNLQLTRLCNTSIVAAQESLRLEENLAPTVLAAYPGESPPHDLCSIERYKAYHSYKRRHALYERYIHMTYLNRFRCNRFPVYSLETINIAKKCYTPLVQPPSAHPEKHNSLLGSLIKSHERRANDIADLIDRFAFATPAVVARDMPSISFRGTSEEVLQSCDPEFDAVLHRPSVRLQIAFPDVSLLQYDCGKLQELAQLLQERKAGGHRVLIFTQMTRILDILEMFLNYHGYLYLRLDGATKIEDRQYITERFNVDSRIFAFIASSRSGGVGINLTGADTVIFYDSDFNPQMDRQCEDRAHRIGQIRDVHIYRFISQYTVEEAMLRKANQKRSLDDIVIQQGEFDWRRFFGADDDSTVPDAGALQRALVEFEDFEDSHAAKVAASEEAAILGEDQDDFGEAAEPQTAIHGNEPMPLADGAAEAAEAQAAGGEEDGGTVTDYMLRIVRTDRDHFRDMTMK